MTSVAVAQHETHSAESEAHVESAHEQTVHSDTNGHSNVDSLAHAAHDTAHAEEGFKIGEMMMHHISDAHQIHLGGSFYIPLPIIILHEGHLDVFSSSNFYSVNEHGELDYHDYKGYRNHHEMIEFVGENAPHEAHGHKVLDFSITTILSAFKIVESLCAMTMVVLFFIKLSKAD